MPKIVWMDSLTGPYAAAAALLVVGGAPKVWAPGDTARALRLLRLPSGRVLVRALGVGEVVTGLVALAWAQPPVALAVAGWYAVFTVVMALALRSEQPIATCGCFGAPDTPPTRLHLALVAAAAATGLAAALRSPSALLPALGGEPVQAVPFVVLTGCAVWFSYLVMSRLAVLR